ncbi:DUF4202 domain-containing protein [Candidatus Poribacteria bacterium]|nr:DUF4202 domain-containing protein [Candidatus Poribacteria bacterium]
MDAARFDAAIAAIEEANAHDPNSRAIDGIPTPFEVAYARHVTGWVTRLTPDPSEALLLAVRGLHIERWKVPRQDYSADRRGYYQWRNRLKRLHAERVQGILNDVGYDPEMVARVGDLIRRVGFPHDPESQVIEDAVSLVFLEWQFAEFAAKTERAKMIDILRQVWERISPQAREIALTLPLEPSERELVAEALSEG